MSLFGCKDDSLLWFIILFLLLFCCGCGCDKCCSDSQPSCGCENEYNGCGRCLR